MMLLHDRRSDCGGILKSRISHAANLAKYFKDDNQMCQVRQLCSNQSKDTREAALDILHVAHTVRLRNKLMQA